MNNDPIFWQLILQAILIALNAVFACAEIAVITMNDAKLAKLAAEGFDVRGGIRCNETQSGPRVARDVTEEELVAAGWPEDAKANFVIQGSSNSHSVQQIKKQLDYGWGYWTFFGKWVVRMWW